MRFLFERHNRWLLHIESIDSSFRQMKYCCWKLSSLWSEFINLHPNKLNRQKLQMVNGTNLILHFFCCTNLIMQIYFLIEFRSSQMRNINKSSCQSSTMLSMICRWCLIRLTLLRWMMDQIFCLRSEPPATRVANTLSDSNDDNVCSWIIPRNHRSRKLSEETVNHRTAVYRENFALVSTVRRRRRHRAQMCETDVDSGFSYDVDVRKRISALRLGGWRINEATQS